MSGLLLMRPDDHHTLRNGLIEFVVVDWVRPQKLLELWPRHQFDLIGQRLVHRPACEGTFHRDQHPDLRADYIRANPPFNISDWGGDRLTDDKRWVYGTPPAGNANYGWLQHILWHLGPRGQAGVVLANGSMSSNQNNEGAIRKATVVADVVDVMVSASRDKASWRTS